MKYKITHLVTAEFVAEVIVDESEINTHISYLTDTINKLNPDIMNICEIEGCDELNRLIKTNFRTAV